MKTTWQWVAAGLLAGSMTMAAQNSTASEPRLKDDLFAGTDKFAQNASSVTEVDMDPDTLGMVGGHNSSRARHTLLSVVHTYTYDKPGMYNMADVDAYRNKLNSGDWHCSVHVRELKSGESTDVCRHHRTDGLDESAIITVEPKSLTFIHTIRKPYAEGEKPGGPESLLSLPLILPLGDELGHDLGEDLPAAARGAEMRSNAALMRAQGAILRAEMASVRPEMLASMAEMRASMAGMSAGLHGPGDWDGSMARSSAAQERALEAARRSLRHMPVVPPALPLAPPAPLVPAAPGPPRF